MTNNLLKEITLPSGRTVLVRNVSRQDVDDALLILGEDKCPNLRAGRKNGAALLETLDLYVRLAVMRPLEESEDDQVEEAWPSSDFSFDDKLEIFASAYQRKIQASLQRLLQEAI